MTKAQKEKYKKHFLILIVIFFSLIFFIKFSFNFIENKIVSTIKSKKFEIFLINEFNNKLENFANESITESEYIFYKDNFSKIYEKYLPIFLEIEIENTTSHNVKNENNSLLKEKLKKIYLKHLPIFLEIAKEIENNKQ
tara:strand:- start:393 stop:809 length:417 start_codon:yes stop_codon:yes gene_type:complete